MRKLSLIRSILKGLALSAMPLVSLMSNPAFAAENPYYEFSVLAGSAVESGLNDAAVGTDARFTLALGVVRDDDGNLVVLESGVGPFGPDPGVGATLRQVSPIGTHAVTTIVGSGTHATTDGVGTAASFGRSLGIARDAATGDIYVATIADNALRRVAPDGTVTTLGNHEEWNYRIAVGDKALYTTGYFKPHVSVYDKDGTFVRTIALDSVDCLDGQVSGGLVESDGIIVTACDGKLVKIDTNDSDAVSVTHIFDYVSQVRLRSPGIMDVFTGSTWIYSIDIATGEQVAVIYSDSSAYDGVRFSQAPQSQAIVVSRPAHGEECPGGGTHFDVGVDRNDTEHLAIVTLSSVQVAGRNIDGVLQEDEITGSSNLCDGVNGDDGNTGNDGAQGHNALIEQSDEPVGTNCAFGGVKVVAGIDYDDSETLEGEEISATSYVCNGDAGQDGEDGADGIDGANGQDGADGQDGAAGAAGKNGLNGKDGADGFDSEGCAATDARDSGALAGLLALAFTWARRKRQS